MSNKLKALYWIVFSIILAALIFVQYYGLVHFHYHVPPGEDPINHYYNAKKFFDGTNNFLSVWKAGGYPPLYHLTIAYSAKLFHTDILQTINWSYPAIIALASLSVFTVVYFLFGPLEALIAFVLYGFTASSSIQLQFDGGFPNLLAAEFLLPLFILIFAKFWLIKRRHRIIIFIPLLFFAVLILFTHHITSFYLAGIIGFSLPTIFIWKWIFNKWKLLHGIIMISILIITYTIIALLFFKTTFFAPARSLLNTGNSYFDQNALWSLRTYPKHIGLGIFFLGACGLLSCLIKNIKEKNDRHFILAAIMTIWILFLFVGSRIHMANPERFARDLATPLSIMAGVCIVYLWKYFQAVWLRIVLVILLILLCSSQIKSRITQAFSYNNMIRFTQADEEAYNYLEAQNAQKVLTNSLDMYLPTLYDNISTTSYYDPTISPQLANQYQYLYLVKSQTGWIPASVHIGVFENIGNLDFSSVGTFKDQSKETILYKNNVLP